MKTIQADDPSRCYFTGIFSTKIDPDLFNLAAMLAPLGQRGIPIERKNCGQNRMAFAQNPAARTHRYLHPRQCAGHLESDEDGTEHRPLRMENLNVSDLILDVEDGMIEVRDMAEETSI